MISEHILCRRWTGSNTNPGNNDGQGLAGSDRSNVVLIEKERYPEGSIMKNGNIFGKFGNNYPENVNKINFLGLNKEDLVSLALLRPGMLKLISLISQLIVSMIFIFLFT